MLVLTWSIPQNGIHGIPPAASFHLRPRNLATKPESPDTRSLLSPGGTLGAFRHATFQAIWIGSLVSNFGTAIQSVGASWMMTSLASSPQMIALVQTAATLPIGILALASGAIADIYDRRKVMLIAQWLMLSISAVLAVLAYAGLVTPWVLLSLTFMLGSAAALYAPAVAASIGEIVPRVDLPGAVALNSVGFNVARSLGPALGGGIVAFGGPSTAFLVNAMSYIGMIAALLRWRRNSVTASLPRERIGGAMIAGLQYASLAPAIRITLLRTLAFTLCGSAVWALMPLVARDLVQGGPLTFGLLLGSLGVGAVVGALYSTSVRRKVSNERVLSLSSLAFGTACVVVAVSPWLALSMAALVLGGTGWVLALSTCSVTVQLWAPRWVLGRALALLQTVIFGSMALGSWLWGQVAEGQGLQLSIAASGGLMLLLPVLGRRLHMPQNEGMNLEPSPAGPDPDLQLDLKPRSGPVVVAIEYRNPVEKVVVFAKCMAEHRRVRIRDGARGWQLLQDVEHPERWIERYHFSTWIDCMRQQQRATLEDAALEVQISAMHAGDEPPVASYMLERPPGAAPAGLRIVGGSEPDEEADHPILSEGGIV